MTAIRDPYPESLADLDGEGFTPIDRTLEPVTPDVKALNRIATALEQIALEMAAKATQPVQNAPGAVLTALPPIQAPVAAGGVCPIHNTPWKIVPAGVSKKSGKPYDAFRACSTQGCDQRPR